MTDLKNLFLYETHKIKGAKFAPFAGFNMPISYRSSIDEHLSVRRNVGLFDVSHMGEIEVSGRDAFKFLNFALTNDLSKCSVGQAQYTLLCNDKGGTTDDLLIYRRDENLFLLCVNASNINKDFQSLLDLSSKFDCTVNDRSSEFGQLAIQGPASSSVLENMTGTNFSNLEKFRFWEGKWMGGDALISRTGYTGEDGFEIYCSPDYLGHWCDGFDEQKVEWVGLVARDSLRLEAGFPLYGHELSPVISPFQAGLSWAVGWNKPDFHGAHQLRMQKASGFEMSVVHYVTDDRRIPRQGNVIIAPNGVESGEVLSGGYSPLLSKAIGSALLDNKKLSSLGMADWKVLLRKNALALDIGPPALKRYSTQKLTE